MNDTDRLRAQGVTLESVGEILGDVREAGPLTPARFVPARLEGTPDLPPPGIYFGMSDDEYHALPALSSNGIKKLAASPMIFWSSTPWLSPKKRKQIEEAKAGGDKEHHVVGKAYHCRIMEGRDEFHRRFVVELDPEDYPEALVHTDQIKAAIKRFQTESTLKKDAGKGVMVPVKPWAKVEDFMPDGGEAYERSAVKADWIRQLRELDPEVQIFDLIQAEHAAEHEGKGVITLECYEQLEIAAAMVERDPELKGVFKDGHAEVVLIWYCRKTGVPMKAKVDYLKLDEIVDLKSIANQRDRAIETAIRFEISSYHYNFQPVVYLEGFEEVRELVRKHGRSAVWSDTGSGPGAPSNSELEWAMRWAKSKAQPEFMWVFQQKGDAPISRGVRFPRTGVTHEGTDFWIDRAKRHFIQYSEVFGTAPWLDTAPIYTINDEDIPRQATEI